jgi:hypothetical protein
MRILGVTASSILKVTSSYESIASATGDGTSSTITFSSIPSTYKHLQLRFICKSTYTTADLGWGNAMTIQMNGTPTAGWGHFLYGDGSTALANSNNGVDYIKIYGTQMSSVSGRTDMVSAGIIDIIDYASTTKAKTFRAFAGCDANTGSTFYGPALTSGFLNLTTAISSLTLNAAFNNFTTSTSFALYGIKG